MHVYLSETQPAPEIMETGWYIHIDHKTLETRFLWLDEWVIELELSRDPDIGRMGVHEIEEDERNALYTQLKADGHFVRAPLNVVVGWQSGR